MSKKIEAPLKIYVYVFQYIWRV